MRIALDPGDRSLLITCGILLVALSVAGVLIMPARNAGPSGIPSTYSTDSAGAKAAYLLLGRLGYEEERWESPPNKLPQKAQNVTLILADPFLAASSEEKTAIQSFVRRGGRVVAAGAIAATFLNLPGIVPSKQFDPDWKKFSAKLPGPISSLAPFVLMKAPVRWNGGQPGGLEYYGDREGGTVVRFPLGSGTIIWWADASSLSNYGLTQASNLDLLLNSVGRNRNVRILWDEYFHGDRPGLWSYLGKTPLPWAMLQLAVLALALILTYSRRSGPVVAPVEESRLSPMEFVETVGDLYARKRAAAGAVEIALHRFQSLLARRLGRSPEAVSAMAAQSLSGEVTGEKFDLAPVISQCELAVKSGITDEAQALKLVQELHDYSRRLRLAGQGD
ncbi:MAG: DUF4350 domain-containing protein [Acidobacteriota bacterium]